MATGSSVVAQFNNASAPVTGAGAHCSVSFGGAAVLQACSNFYVEVTLSDPSNTGDPATFEVQLVGGMETVNNTLGSPITAPGIYTVTASSPVTYWQANLVSLSGGVSPTVSVNGLSGE